MPTFSKPSTVVELIDDVITAKVRAHVPTDQIYQMPADQRPLTGGRTTTYDVDSALEHLDTAFDNEVAATLEAREGARGNPRVPAGVAPR